MGDYELLEEIAHGGMGMIFKARQKSLDRLVALKLMRSGQFATERDLRRFQAEAHAAAHLDHPNIMPIYEIGAAEGRAFFSMKLLAGGSLRNPDGSAGLAKLRWAAAALTKVARAVQYAHERGILHRDLKPENILLDDRGEPHVTDFGLAKRIAEEEVFTLPGAVLGTPAYMAPEQAEGKSRDITTAADIYSLGSVLYYLITGRPPFEAETALATMHQVLQSDVIAPSRVNPRVDRDLETICLKCLEKAPTLRYRTAEELADDLERWLRGETIHARPSSAPERVMKWIRRHPFPTVLVVLLFLVCVFGVSGIVWQWRRADREANIAMEALEQARNSLWKADLEQAHSVRLTREAGRREKALTAIRDAAKIRPSAELRSEAIAALSLTDLGAHETFLAHPPGAERAQRDLFLPQINRDLTVVAWPLSDQSFVFKELASGKEVRRLPSAIGEVRMAIWSADDRYFVVLSTGGLQVWDLQHLNVAFQWLEGAAIRSVVISPNAELIGIIEEGGARVFRVQNPKEQESFAAATTLGFCHASDGIAFAQGRKVTVWDYEGKQAVKEFYTDADVLAIYWSPDDRVVLCVQNDKNIFGHDVITGHRNIYEGHTASPRNVTFGTQGAIFASSTHEGNTRLWDTLTPDEMTSGESGAALRFSQDGKRLAFVRPDGVGIWPIHESPKAYSRLIGRMDFDLGNFLAFSPNNRWIFCISHVIPGLWVWNVEKRELMDEALFPGERISWIGFAGDRIAISGTNGLTSWRLSVVNGEPALSDPKNLAPPGPFGFGQGPAISADQGRVFLRTGAMEGRWITQTNGIKVEGEIGSAAFHPTGEILAIGINGPGGTELFSVPELRSIRRLGGLPAEVEFSPDARWLANFTAVQCEIWETREWKKIKSMPRRVADVAPGQMTFSRDGRWLAYVNSSHSCILLETATWREVATFEVPRGPGASRVAFSPNREYLCLFGKAALHLYHLPSLRAELRELGIDW